ncbi:MAG: HxsD-like protein [Candidatus Falkowbacteria bacterium]
MTIRFNKKLYSAKAVRRGLADFKDLADFKMTAAGAYYAVEMKNCREYPEKAVKNELANYILQLMKT